MLCPQCNFANRPTARVCAQCGKPLPTSSAHAFGPALKNRYQLVSQLGKGGMGAVYLAEDTTLFGRKWVVKEMLLPGDPANQTETEKNFQLEAQLLAHLNHERIPTITDYFPQSNKYYIVMDWVTGQDLEKRLQSLGAPLAERDVIRYALQVTEILEYLGQQNPPVIHRDLKPANLIVDSRDNIHLVDFGIARAKKIGGTSVSKDSQLWGTLGYAPPEQALGMTEPRSDIFALGATMHHLLTNRDPRDPQHKGFDPLPVLVPTIAPPLAQLVAAMLNLDVSKRPTASVARKQLETLANVEPLVFTPDDLAYTLQDFVDLCDKHWDVALHYLKQRHVEDWLKEMGRLDLYTQARQIRTDLNRRKKSVDPDEALESFLRAMDPTRTAATLMVTPADQSITVAEGADITVSLTAKSNGRYVNGTVQVSPGGITSTATLFECKAPKFTTALLVQFKPQPTTLTQRAEVLLEGRFANAIATVNYVQVPPLRFRSGVIVRRVPELAQNTLSNWNDALHHFQNGDIERWLSQWRRNDLSSRAAQLRTRGERGLVDLIYAVDPQLAQPQPQVTPARLDFGNLNKGVPAEAVLTLSNVSAGVLSAELASGSSFLRIEPRELIVHPRQSRNVSVRLNTKALSGNSVGQNYTAAIELVANTGVSTSIVKVSFRVVHAPLLEVKEKRLRLRLQTPIPRVQIEIENSGGDILSGSATTPTGWLTPVSALNFNLPADARALLAFDVDPKALKPGESAVGSVQITSNGGQADVSVELFSERQFPLTVFIGMMLLTIAATIFCVGVSAVAGYSDPVSLIFTGLLVTSVGLIVTSAGTAFLYLRS